MQPDKWILADISFVIIRYNKESKIWIWNGNYVMIENRQKSITSFIVAKTVTVIFWLMRDEVTVSISVFK